MADKSFSDGNEIVWLAEVDCVGNEEYIFQCSSAVEFHDCSNESAVGVKCYELSGSIINNFLAESRAHLLVSK